MWCSARLTHRVVTSGVGREGRVWRREKVCVSVELQHSWVAENQGLSMLVVFGLGYLGIIFEEFLAFNKSGVGLLMAGTVWEIRSIGGCCCCYENTFFS